MLLSVFDCIVLCSLQFSTFTFESICYRRVIGHWSNTWSTFGIPREFSATIFVYILTSRKRRVRTNSDFKLKRRHAKISSKWTPLHLGSLLVSVPVMAYNSSSYSHTSTSLLLCISYANVHISFASDTATSTQMVTSNDNDSNIRQGTRSGANTNVSLSDYFWWHNQTKQENET